MDTDTIRRTHSLINMVGMDLGRAAARSSSYSQWACPFHDDGRTPSLTVYSDGHYHCFGCGAHGDVITWVMQRRGLDFRSACAELGALFPLPSVRNSSGSSAKASIALAETSIPVMNMFPPTPSEAWQDAAMDIVVKCENELWASSSVASAKVKGYLTGRGLQEEILREFHIGYNCEDVHIDVRNPDSKLWVPEGITIPLWHESTNNLYGINVRLARKARAQWKDKTGRDAKYLLASGSKRAPLGLESIKDKTHAFVVEGEFDAVLLLQTLRAMGAHASDVGAFTMGSASSQDVDKWLLLHPELLSPRRFLVSTDGDRPGQNAANRWLDITPGRGRLWLPPVPCKDVTELWQKQGYEGVSRWITAGLQKYP